MEKSKLKRTIIDVSLGLACFICVFAVLKSCTSKQQDPAIQRLQGINDSLYQIIDINNIKTDSLFMKIDSLQIHQDTIIQQQQITNEIALRGLAAQGFSISVAFVRDNSAVVQEIIRSLPSFSNPPNTPRHPRPTAAQVTKILQPHHQVKRLISSIWL